MKKKILNVGVISCSDMAQSHMLAVKNHEQACPGRPFAMWMKKSSAKQAIKWA